MNTCDECEHQKVPQIFDKEHPCLDCHGERVVIDGSNFEAKPPEVRRRVSALIKMGMSPNVASSLVATRVKYLGQIPADGGPESHE